MHFHRSRVQSERLDPDTHNLFHLELFKNPVKSAALGPAIHACVNSVPVTKSLRQAAPLASMLGNVQHGIQKLQVG
jgi:hypothetical protein